MSSRWLTPKNWPLAAKLASVMFVLAVVPLVVVALFNARDVGAQAEKREQQALQRRAATAGRRLEERVARLRTYVELVASNPALSAAMADRAPAADWFEAHPDVRDLLVSVRQSDAWFQNVYLLDENGICIATSEAEEKPAMIGRSYDYRPYFRQPRASGRPFVSDVLKNANSPGTAIFVSAPFPSGGVAVIKIDTDALHDVAADLARGGGRVWMVDRFGVVVSDATADGVRLIGDEGSAQFHPLADVQRYAAQFYETKRYGDPDGDNYFARVDRPLGLSELWQRLQRNEAGARQFDVPATAGAAAEPTMVGYAPVWSDEEQPYGYVVIGDPSAHFREPLDAITQASLLRIVLAFAAVALVIGLSLRGFSRRVGELADATQRLSEGAPTEALRTEPRDELGVLAASFNRMTDRLATSVHDQQSQRKDAERAKAEAEASAAIRDALLVRVGTRLQDSVATLREAMPEVEADEARRALLTTITEIERHADALLALSEQGLPATAPESVDLTRLLRAAVTRAGPVAALAESSVDFEADNLLGRIQTDPARLTAVVDELLSNAARFTRGGQIQLRAVRRDEDGQVEISIVDDGIGMTRGQRGQLQVPQPRDDGAGFGLHLAAQITAHLGGKLSVRSNPGEGTTATLVLPIAPDVDGS